MIIQIATQGTSTSPILEGVRRYSIDKLYLLHNEGSRSTGKEVKEIVETMGMKCELRMIKMFDQTSITSEMIKIYKSHKNDEILVNITGGTKLMSASASIGGVLIGAKVFYVVENIDNKPLIERVITLPMPRIAAKDINPLQKSILELINESGGKLPYATNKVRDKFEISKQMASYHLKELVKLELVEMKIQGRQKNANLTPEGHIILQLSI